MCVETHCLIHPAAVPCTVFHHYTTKCSSNATVSRSAHTLATGNSCQNSFPLCQHSPSTFRTAPLPPRPPLSLVNQEAAHSAHCQPLQQLSKNPHKSLQASSAAAIVFMCPGTGMLLVCFPPSPIEGTAAFLSWFSQSSAQRYQGRGVL